MRPGASPPRRRPDDPTGREVHPLRAAVDDRRGPEERPLRRLPGHGRAAGRAGKVSSHVLITPSSVPTARSASTRTARPEPTTTLTPLLSGFAACPLREGWPLAGSLVDRPWSPGGCPSASRRFSGRTPADPRLLGRIIWSYVTWGLGVWGVHRRPPRSRLLEEGIRGRRPARGRSFRSVGGFEAVLFP